MEGIGWLIACAYLIIGCFYYVASINRIVSFIIKMNGIGTSVNAVSLCILLMALIIAWPYLMWLDMRDYRDAHNIDCGRDKCAD